MLCSPGVAWSNVLEGPGKPGGLVMEQLVYVCSSGHHQVQAQFSGHLDHFYSPTNLAYKSYYSDIMLVMLEEIDPLVTLDL